MRAPFPDEALPAQSFDQVGRSIVETGAARLPRGTKP